MKKKVLITDDHTIVRKGVVSLLKDNDPFIETHEAETAAEMVKALKANQYDLLVLDLNLPDANAEKLIHLAKEQTPDTPIIVFSMFPVQVMETSMLKLGVAKYVCKGDDVKKLLRAVEEIFLGKFATTLQTTKKSATISPFASLSPKELSVMIALLEGKSNKTIAEQLSLSASTIATYKQRIHEKTNTKSVAELMKLALQFDMYHYAAQEPL